VAHRGVAGDSTRVSVVCDGSERSDFCLDTMNECIVNNVIVKTIINYTS
jgi:hypothetical protein